MLVFVVCPVLKAQKIDSLKSLLMNEEVENRGMVALNLFINYRLQNLDSALYFAELSDELATDDGDSLLIVRAQNAIGWIYQQKGFQETAIEHYLSALQIARNNNYTDRERHILNNLGVASNIAGNYDDALEYHFQSLELREAVGNKREIAVANNNIGLVYYRIRVFDRAIEYFKNALTLHESLGNNSQMISTLINLGLCYSFLTDFEESLGYFNRVLELCDNNCSNRIYVETYNGAGVAYFYNDKLAEAKSYLTKSDSLAEFMNLPNYQVINRHFLAQISVRNNRLDRGIELLEQSQTIALSIGYRTFIGNNFRLYAEIYSAQNDYLRAFDYQKKYDSLNTSIMNEELIANLADIQADYLERENLQTIASQDEEISRRTTLLILSLIIILLITVILFILYRINQLRKKANTQLSEANAIIEKQNKELTDINNVLEDKVKERTKELKDTNAALLKSNTDLDNFIYKTSHDIRGPLATLQGMCNIALMDIIEPKSVDYFEKIGKTADRLNEILSKLLVINQINNSMIASSQVDIGQLMRDILQEYQHAPDADKIRVDNNVQEMNSFRSDEGLLRIILNNLISNAFKFYNSSNRVDSWIRIDADRCNGHVEFRVTDNGIGIDEAAAGKIFEIFAKASEVSDSAGLGLYLVKLAVEKLDGKINHSKTEDGYTQFTVELPYR